MKEKLVVVRTNPDGSVITLFKYFSPQKLADFIDGRLSLTPPRYLNDPFEFAVRRETPSRKEVESMFEEFVSDEYETLARLGRIQMSFPEFKKTRYVHREAWITRILSQDFQNSEPKDMQESLSQVYGVICLTEVPDNLLMWSHYTDSYKGFVAEFMCDWEHLSHVPRARGLSFGIALKAEYSAHLSVFDQNFSNAVRCFCTKGEEWSYEREWRVVRLLATSDFIETGSGYRYVRFKPDSLKRIILGHRMLDVERRQITELTRKAVFRHVQLQEAKPRLDKHRVDCKELR